LLHRSTDLVVVTSGLGAEFGGIGQVSQSIVRALQQHRYIVDVVTSAPAPSKLVRGLALGARLAGRALRRPRLVLYEHRGLAAAHAVVPRLRRLPYAVFLHGIELWRPLGPSQRRVLERASHLLSNSRTTIELARAHNPWLPCARIVHLGVAMPSYAQRQVGAPTAVMVGRMDANERYKGHDEVLDAWPAIHAAVPTGRLVIIGHGSDLERLRARAQTEALRNVEFTGFLSDAAKDAWLDRATFAFALGSDEGFGLASVEAAARGVPLLGLRGTVLEELFPEQAGVRFIEGRSKEQIAGAAIALLRQGDETATFGARAREYVAGHYTTEHFSRRLRVALEPALRAASRRVSPRTGDEQPMQKARGDERHDDGE
jgi:phosphatidylinositol alpha-1,6-mannosyltransferase